MALVRTTLTAAITASQTTLGVNSTSTGFPPVGVFTNPQQPIAIDDEFMYLVYVPVAGTIVVRSRGADGTSASTHDVLAPVVTSSAPGDFPSPAAGLSTIRPIGIPDILTYGQDGVIAVPSVDRTTAFLAKATAGAFTLLAPSLALNGITLVLTNQTAAAHVVTATSLIDDGTSATALSTITFPALIGSTITLIAQNGLWNVSAKQGTTVVIT